MTFYKKTCIAFKMDHALASELVSTIWLVGGIKEIGQTTVKLNKLDYISQQRNLYNKEFISKWAGKGKRYSDVCSFHTQEDAL